MPYVTTERTASYGAGATKIQVDEYVVEDIDTELGVLGENITELISILYNDMKTIDDMDSKYLDVVSDECTIIKNELDDMLDGIEKAAANNQNIADSFINTDIAQLIDA